MCGSDVMILLPGESLLGGAHCSVIRAQELCESRGGRPGLPSLINLRFKCGRSKATLQLQLQCRSDCMIIPVVCVVAGDATTNQQSVLTLRVVSLLQTQTFRFPTRQQLETSDFATCELAS